VNAPLCSVIGVHAGGVDDDAAAEALAACRLAIGAPHQLAAIATLLAPAAERRDARGRVATIVAWCEEAIAAARPVVVLASGDPLCFGIAAPLAACLGRERLRILPARSCIQLAAARLGLAWQDARIVSAHAGDSGEWAPGARHDHALAPLAAALAHAGKLICLTSPANDPARIARLLLAAGLGEAFLVDVAARLGHTDECVTCDLTPAEAANSVFAQPNVVVLRRLQALPARARFGHPDEAYQQRQPQRGLITRREVRAVSLAQLRLAPDDLVWDLGAGSGSVGIEAAQLCPDGHVYAIEKNPDDYANAVANARHFGVLNYTPQLGRAPAGLAGWPDPDAVFIGGSGGELAALIALCLARLRPGGRLVMNFVTLENLGAATACLRAAGLAWELVQLSAARSRPIRDLNRLVAENPVWIVSAGKELACHIPADA
jgi:precorrin-6B C5,15-methyltransferase / cobalt-precorrin-6B C5,C15-methyltransferase